MQTEEMLLLRPGRFCFMFLVFLIVLFGRVESSAPKIYYVLLVPSELHFPSTEKICLQMDSEQPNVMIKVAVTLEVGGQMIILYNGNMPPTGRLQCYSFQVPPPDEERDETAVIHIVGSGDAEFKENKFVLIRRVNNGIIIQTDKPTYRPSQTVNFRIVTLDENFVASRKKYPIVELKDSSNNRIAQWLEVQPKMGIVDLSFNLTSEPLLGNYTISVNNGKALKSFIVEEQVLPRFEVIIESPSEINALEPTFQLKVCGRYTYGKGVDGEFRVSMCREAAWDIFMAENTICSNVGGETDVNGCFSTSINTSVFKLIEYFGVYIVIATSLVERGTDVKFETSTKVHVSFVLGTLTFEDLDTYYKVGQPFHAELVVLDQNRSPVKFQKAALQIQIGDAMIDMEELTDNMGKIHYNLDTSKWTGTVNLRGYLKTPFKKLAMELTPFIKEARHTAYPYYSEAQSLVKLEPIFGVIPCERQVNIRVTYELSRQELRPNSNSVEFYYLVIGKGAILLFGQKSILIDKTKPVRGVLSVPVIFTSDYAPAPKMIGYIMLKNGTMAADRLKFKMENCFRNKVKLKFSQEEALPKSRLNLHVEAAAESLCALRAVDKSVQISYMNEELTAQKIYDMFPFSERSGYNYLVDEFQLQPNPCWLSDTELFRFLPRRPRYENNFMDIFSLFKDINLKILTNYRIQKPKESIPCLVEKLVQPLVVKDVADILGTTSAGLEEKIRKYFPETWIWKLVPVNGMGQADLQVTVPDTITEWSAGAFCTGLGGFGLSPAVSLRGFQPFFVELILPYSVVRGERFTLKASIFNYLQECIKVAVLLSTPEDVKVLKCLRCKTPFCVCPDRAFTFEWDITPLRVGSVTLTVRADTTNGTCDGKLVVKPTSGQTDIVRRELLVKPGGVRKDITRTFFLCLKAPIGEVRESFSLDLPETPVEDSVNAAISVMGDALGSALQNLDRLIVAPYGCGEQNMLNFAPIIYVLQYLEATGQLINELRARATGYLQSGYQRELTFKHADGSFSAFGESDGDGSSWLTAFVAKCFSQARSYVFIDEEVISKAVTWLGTLQQPGGCFKSKGKLFHTLMKGGVEDDVSLSAYITAALLELGTPENNSILVNALSCVKQKVTDSTNLYTQALLAYAFSLTKDTATRQILLNKLYSSAKTSGGQMYWEYKLLTSEGGSAGSANVELTSYILLALVSRPTVSSEEIQKASQIVKWLAKQQNPYGGFSSTQDTVVAIQALAKYSRTTFNNQGSLFATVTDDKGFTKEFNVDKRNRLLQQTEALPGPGKYSLFVNGSGCILIQSALKYNVYPKGNNLAFNLKVAAQPYFCSNDAPNEFLLNIWVSYNGTRDVTNMVVIEVEMLSGHRAQDDTTKLLFSFPLVKKVSIDLDSVTIYLDELSHNEEMFFLIISQTNVVQNMKPAVIKVYDYYTPEENTVGSYITPCP